MRRKRGGELRFPQLRKISRNPSVPLSKAVSALRGTRVNLTHIRAEALASHKSKVFSNVSEFAARYRAGIGRESLPGAEQKRPISNAEHDHLAEIERGHIKYPACNSLYR